MPMKKNLLGLTVSEFEQLAAEMDAVWQQEIADESGFQSYQAMIKSLL